MKLNNFFGLEIESLISYVRSDLKILNFEDGVIPIDKKPAKNEDPNKNEICYKKK